MLVRQCHYARSWVSSFVYKRVVILSEQSKTISNIAANFIVYYFSSHNLNLAHSGLREKDGSDDPYGDKTCSMGVSYQDDSRMVRSIWSISFLFAFLLFLLVFSCMTTHFIFGLRIISQCFNPAKNYFLGWFDLQKESLNPLQGLDTNIEDFNAAAALQRYILNGIDDYQVDGTASNGALVVLKLELNQGMDYYIGYNRATGGNSGVKAAANLITIYEKENTKTNGYGRSTLIAALDLGEQYVFQFYNETEYFVYVTVESKSNDGKDVELSVLTSLPLPTSAPTPFLCDASLGRLKIQLQTDSFGSETSWKLTETSSSEIIAYAGPSLYESNTLYTEHNCLKENTCYEFKIEDKYGDGIVRNLVNKIEYSV